MNDSEIREALCSYMDETQTEKFRIIDELVIGKSRADIVLVTNILTGYEIKGDTDTYTRLPKQITEYDKYFQQNFLVVGSAHRNTAEKHLPPHWGILCVSSTEKHIQIETIRQAEPNPSFTMIKQLSLLWRKELKNILKANNLPRCTGKRKSYISKYLLEHVSKHILQQQLCNELFERDWTLL